ncbi:MAG: hypothetical protein ABIR24_03955 [Verrucomicrobiota bacterium]
MNRWIYFWLCVAFGLALLFCGWRMPIYLRAVDASVLHRAGEKSSGLVEQGMALMDQKKLGAVELISQTAQRENISGHEKLRSAVDDSAKAHPEWQILGIEPRLKMLLDFAQTLRPKNSAAKTPSTFTVPKTKPFTELVIQSENREKALKLLRTSPYPVVQQLLRCRALTNTVLFSSSQSSSGQAFDAALSICGLLLEEQRLTAGLSNAVLTTSSAALRGENSQPLEQLLLDFMSLGQRFNWGQIVAFCEKIDDAETLRLQANLARKADAQLPVLFSAVQLSGKPAAVAKYLMNFGQTGQNDLAASLRFGAGGVNELLKRNQRLHRSNFQGKLNAFSGALVYLPWQKPKLALGLKWFLYLAAGFLLALAMHFARPLPSAAERPFHVRSFHVAREFLFALGFLLFVLLLSEPFLAQESQNVEFPIRLKLPTVGNLVATENANAHGSFMNQLSLLTLLLFFVLQALLYVASLLKLSELRRQTFPARTKLKLLENEEHLFDAGLYLGFAGTIISLILVSMGVIKPSLMAAYSSTSFGVIFVSIFKIFHLRPLRRKLLLDSEAAKNIPQPPTEHTLPAPL